jgi:hypothetical protein
MKCHNDLELQHPHPDGTLRESCPQVASHAQAPTRFQVPERSPSHRSGFWRPERTQSGAEFVHRGLGGNRQGRRSCLALSTKRPLHTHATHIGPFLIAKLRTPFSDVNDGNCYMTNALLCMTSYDADGVHSAESMLATCLQTILAKDILFARVWPIV